MTHGLMDIFDENFRRIHSLIAENDNIKKVNKKKIIKKLKN